MTQQTLAVHETLELREMLTFKNVCLTKAKTMQGLVSDDELRTLLQADVQKTVKNIQELQGLLAKG